MSPSVAAGVALSPEPAPPDSLDREIQREARSRARTRWIIVAVLAVLALAATALWWTTRSQLPDPPSKTLESVRAVMPKIDGMPPEVRVALAGAALFDLEADRLPSKLRAPFGELESVPREMASLVALRALADPEVLTLWNGVCPGGADALVAITALPKVQQAHEMYTRCDLARHRFLSQHEVDAASAPLLALAYTTYGYLESKHALLVEEEALLRVLVVSSQ